MFDTETVGPYLVQKLKWGGGGGGWSPWPPSGYAPEESRITNQKFTN